MIGGEGLVRNGDSELGFDEGFELGDCDVWVVYRYSFQPVPASDPDHHLACSVPERERLERVFGEREIGERERVFGGREIVVKGEWSVYGGKYVGLFEREGERLFSWRGRRRE